MDIPTIWSKQTWLGSSAYFQASKVRHQVWLAQVLLLWVALLLLHELGLVCQKLLLELLWLLLRDLVLGLCELNLRMLVQNLHLRLLLYVLSQGLL